MWFPCYENFSEIPRFALFKLQFEWRPFFNTYSRRYRRKSRSPCATFPTGNLSLSLTPPNVVVKTEQGFFILNTNSPDLLLYFYQKKKGDKNVVTNTTSTSFFTYEFVLIRCELCGQKNVYGATYKVGAVHSIWEFWLSGVTTRISSEIDEVLETR